MRDKRCPHTTSSAQPMIYFFSVAWSIAPTTPSPGAAGGLQGRLSSIPSIFVGPVGCRGLPARLWHATIAAIPAASREGEAGRGDAVLPVRACPPEFAAGLARPIHPTPLT